MSRFAGICRGGPMDGKCYEAPADWFKVAHFPPLQSFKEFKDFQPSTSIETSIYNWREREREWWWEHWDGRPDMPASRN